MSAFRHGWSRAEQPWHALRDASLLECRWPSSPFADAWQGSIPTAPGVYVITGCPPVQVQFANSSCPLYVGQTLNLRSRFGQHLKGGTAVRTIRLFADLHFCYHVVADDTASSLLRHYEQLLQNAFGPIANTRNAIRSFTVGTPVSVWRNQPSKQLKETSK